jgi:RNA polymerase sigma factor (sigma-70 family)
VRRATARHADLTLTELATAARSGDAVAWDQLARRVQNVAWKVINSYRLEQADAEDAFAAAMFRLADNFDRIRDPERIPGWLATTARNEVMSIFRTQKRVELTDDPVGTVIDGTDLDRQLLLDELQRAVRSSLRKLSKTCQQLLRLLTADPPMPYEQIGEFLEMPHGTIGPTRARCLEALRKQPALQRYLKSGP